MSSRPDSCDGTSVPSPLHFTQPAVWRRSGRSDAFEIGDRRAQFWTSRRVSDCSGVIRYFGPQIRAPDFGWILL
jgi:hypothetical protein